TSRREGCGCAGLHRIGTVGGICAITTLLRGGRAARAGGVIGDVGVGGVDAACGSGCGVVRAGWMEAWLRWLRLRGIEDAIGSEIAGKSVQVYRRDLEWDGGSWSCEVSEIRSIDLQGYTYIHRYQSTYD
ncbi:MAG: hypothetical protein GWP10_15070, partial [Nitrospiraceae bacterium]|nr:hypothetical protein [Nitrospiraceae bacterium]